MMNLLWASKKGQMELEDLMVYNMVKGAVETTELTPEEKGANLQQRISDTMGLFAAHARAQAQKKKG